MKNKIQFYNTFIVPINYMFELKQARDSIHTNYNIGPNITGTINIYK